MLSIASLVAFLITVLIVALVWWAWTQLRGLLPLPEPVATIVHIIVVVILALIIIYALAGLFSPSYGFRGVFR